MVKIINIIDVGARNGIQDIWKNVPHIAHLFEPDLEEYKKLLSTLPKNQKLYNFALSDKEQDLVINLCKVRQLSSVYEYDMELTNKYSTQPERWSIEKKVIVKAKTIDYFDIDADYIKIDVEGYSYPVLKGAENTLNNTIGVEAEVEFMKLRYNQVLFPEIHTYLYNKGFILERISQKIVDRKIKGKSNKSGYTVVKGSGQVHHADVYYLRPPEDPVVLNKIKQAKIIYSARKQVGFLYTLDNLLQRR